MAWWFWMLLGLGLLAAELGTPGGFYVLFFGVAALLVGGVVAVSPTLAGAWQWLLFSVLSIASLLLFRRRLLARFGAPPAERDAIDTLRGEVALLGEDLAPGALGKAELRGTVWSVRNVDERPLRAGQRCRVTRIDGLTLLVRGE